MGFRVLQSSEDTQNPVSGFRPLSVEKFTAPLPVREQGLLPTALKETLESTADKFGKGSSLLEKGAIAATLPLRLVGATARATGEAIAEPLAPIAKKVFSALRPEAQEDLIKFGQALGEKLSSIKEKIDPEIYQSLADIAEVAGFYTGGKGAQAGIKAVKPTIEAGVETGIQAGKELVKTGVEKGKQVGEKVIEKGAGLSESLIANINRINPSKRQEFQVQQGVSMEKWLKDRGIVSTRNKTIEELGNRFKILYENVDTALDKIPGNYRDSRITKVADEAADFARSAESKEVGRISALAEKAKGEGLTAKEINELKRFYEKNIKIAYKKDPTKTSAQVQRATNRDSDIREALMDIADKNGFTNLRELNKEIQASKFLGDKIAGTMEGQAANNLMTFTDWIAITPGVLNPNFFAAFVAKKAFSTETIRAFAARALNGFPKVKPLPRADLDEIIKRAQEVLKRTEDIKIETQKAGILADELQKAGFTMSEGQRGFITDNPIALSRNEQALIRAAKNNAEQKQIVQYILEQRANGKAVGKNFTVEDIDNVPILNPRERFNSNKMEKDISF